MTTVGCISSPLSLAVCAVLAQRRARRDRRLVALQHQGTSGAGHPGSDLLPEQRRGRCDEGRLRCGGPGVESRRWCYGKRVMHATSGGRSRYPRAPARCR